MKNYILTLLGAATIVSCGTMGNTASKVGKEQASIANTKWVLADKVKGTVPTLNIDGDKINGNGGCNRYFGTATFNTQSGTFTPSGVGSTKMACENMTVENNFLGALQKVNKYVVSDSSLELYQDGLLLLKFNKAE
ncbi:heat-shock protein HslJ [Chryseobacterium sp. Leaf404]|uniref:META domain-containing protein n=1 Tax=unclassified Chryseobacterium TaxID=2593645 RepID=UPI0006FA5A31|nr:MULTISPECIES: META domain-containing protein [unclassified Chryseobacterium]KQT18533.1 heat-shock protein HslJ [Chryseobacterium sp. Leaf404]